MHHPNILRIKGFTVSTEPHSNTNLKLSTLLRTKSKDE